MQQQERDLIADLFGRLQQFENQPRDPEAERLIASSSRRQPASPYLLVQTVLVQEEALKQAQARIAELEAKASGQRSFLGTAPQARPVGLGTEPRRPAAGSPLPRRRALLAGAAVRRSGGGSFLRTALTTAAGVAGGALLFEGIRNMFGHSTQAFASPAMQPVSSLLPPDSSPLMPPGSALSADLAQDDGAADDYDTRTSDDSGFDSSSDDI